MSDDKIKRPDLSEEEVKRLKQNFRKTKDLNINNIRKKETTEYSYPDDIREALNNYEHNLTLDDFNPLYDQIPGELNGDENYEFNIMPDGTLNEKYQFKKALEIMNRPEKEVLPWDRIPMAIRKNALQKIGAGIALMIVVLVTYILALIDYPTVIVTACIMALFVYVGVKKILIGRNNEFVKFEGIVVSSKIYGLTNSSKYMVVKISDGEKFLNLKLNVCPDITEGSPITVYLHPNLPIIPSQFGPLAEHIIAYKLDVSTEATDELIADGKITADEYIRHDPISGEIREKVEKTETIASYDKDNIEAISQEKSEKIASEEDSKK